MADSSFDGLRYIAGYPDLIAALGADAEAGRMHYELAGRAEGRNPLLFDPFLYGASSVDLARAIGYDSQALSSHYIIAGYGEGRATSGFDAYLYGASNPDVARDIGYNRDGLIFHYLAAGADEGRAVSGFDAYLYGASNPDVARDIGYNRDGLLFHYLAAGADEGRATSGFDPYLYGASNPDLARDIGYDRDALLRHYLEHGADEGRPTTGFDALAYGAAYPDLAAIANDPDALIYHYLAAGADEGRSQDGGTFDAVAYLLTYPDLGNAGIGVEGARQHWYAYGQTEGRVGDALYGREQTTHDFTDGMATGVIDSPGDRDWFQVDLQAGVPVALGLYNANGETLIEPEVRIYNALGVQVQFGQQGPTTSGTYYISVQGVGQATGSYTVLAQRAVQTGAATSDLHAGYVYQGPADAFTTVNVLATNPPTSYSGFRFVDVDRLVLPAGTYDMANSENIGRLIVAGSANFTHVGNLADLEILKPTAPTSLSVRYEDAAVASSTDAVDLFIGSYQYGVVSIGSTGNASGGIETLRVNVNWTALALSTGAAITDLQSDITRLEIIGNQGLTVTQQLRASVHEVAVNILSGSISLNMAGAGAGISYAGSNYLGYSGSNTVVLGNFSDTLVTYGPGIDTITTGAGNDSISTGGGFDRIIAGANLTGADMIDGGADSATLVIGDANYTDADFANVHNISALEITGFFNTTIGANAQAAGIRTIKLTSASASLIDASAFTVALTVDATAGGADTVRTGSGDDRVTFNGNAILQLGAGFDVATGSGTLDLDVHTGVDRYEGAALTLIGDAGAAQTVVVVATSVTLGAGLTDADYAFQITAPTFIKANVGTASVIALTGTAGADVMQVNAADLGANLTANLGGGTDQLALSGGVATDANFAHLTSVERLTHAAGSALNATIGAAAAAAGINTVVLGTGAHSLVVDGTYGQSLTVTGTGSGDWNLDASASAQTVTFFLSSINSADHITGSTASDDLLSTGGGGDLTGVSLVERITVATSASSTSPEVQGTLVLDTAPGDLNGTTFQTVTIAEDVFRTNLSRGFSTANVNASAATADLFVSGGYQVTTGSGNDRIATSTLAAGNSFMSTGWTVSAGAGDDRVLGNGLHNIIDGGSGADRISGGLREDTLTGGADADAFVYYRFTESNGQAVPGNSGVTGQDVITDFVSGVDRIDVTHVFDQPQLAGDTIAFVGNAADLAVAQALLTPLDNTLDAVYQQDTNTLWFDNGDGVLDANDMQIILTGVGSLIAADVMAGSVVTPDPNFAVSFFI